MGLHPQKIGLRFLSRYSTRKKENKTEVDVSVVHTMKVQSLMSSKFKNILIVLLVLLLWVVTNTLINTEAERDVLIHGKCLINENATCSVDLDCMTGASLHPPHSHLACALLGLCR
jgi:hypothetical protein